MRLATGLRSLWRAKVNRRSIYTAAQTSPVDEYRKRMLPQFAYEPFASRHIGPRPDEVNNMLALLGYANMEPFIANVLPQDLPECSSGVEMKGLPVPLTESEMLATIRHYASMNKIKKSYIGLGYYGTITPAVIQRCILENPAWYTQYTPYQPEISQGRLESLLNFQTMISELTGMEVANASLLDEGTAAAEAMVMLFYHGGQKKPLFLVDRMIFPQTIACLQTRAEFFGIKIKLINREDDIDSDAFGVLFQYPDILGGINIYNCIQKAKSRGVGVVCAADLLALCMLKSPGSIGADVVVGSTQRFGVPMGYGGPHAAYFAARDEYRRKFPGRIVGISQDAAGRRALRLTLQTREQHIRRDKATSNICTAQALLANVAAMYAIYHGPLGLKKIASRVHQQAVLVANAAQKFGHDLINECFFDTVIIKPKTSITAAEMKKLAESYNVLLGSIGDEMVSISLDETVTDEDIKILLNILAMQPDLQSDVFAILEGTPSGAIGIPDEMKRNDNFMPQNVFNSYHSETEMMRYMNQLQSKDLSLVHSMIPLGSCTMKLNSATEMRTLSLPEFQDIHPFSPPANLGGYGLVMKELKEYLCAITGFEGVSLMPNSGAQGEYTGLLVMRAYHRASGQGSRNICLIPVSAHGTNPASATMAGLKVVPVKCNPMGGVELSDLEEKIKAHRDQLACIMITFPSTFGVFDEGMKRVAELVHTAGGLVYMDGANMNAQLGLCRPADFGVDVCHLNLHKTFCIPHGGGGPGAGPICVSAKLAPFLPTHPAIPHGSPKAIGPVSAAPFGSASILPISWAFIRMMGEDGLRKSSQIALLNANYMMKRLDGHYKILYQNPSKLCAHEFIIDCRPFKGTGNIDVLDIAKRLQVLHRV
ncbi:hypothetical protein PSACC_03116 [Paramicrosporidium saccamoebae]|uniref:Glycine cleavage system P protein n=1 Tax=Paramicrosporidium saccamoebae TaxID=1246581 RepID=A0A2H9TH19_9FUNG|nr:hypothetical protein PSACC_03116 [Paramicrosporidium saccamoebae]